MYAIRSYYGAGRQARGRVRAEPVPPAGDDGGLAAEGVERHLHDPRGRLPRVPDLAAEPDHQAAQQPRRTLGPLGIAAELV